MNRVLFYFTWKYKGDWESIYNALESKEVIDKKDLNKVLLQKKDNYLCLIDFIYPENLKFIYKPPFSLFWEGNFNLFADTNKTSTFSITNLNNKEINFFKDFLSNLSKKNSDFCVCVTAEDKKLIELLKKENYKFILVSNMSLKNTKEKFKIDPQKNQNCLIITEMPENNKQKKLDDYSYARTWSGLTRKTCIGTENKPEYIKALNSIFSIDQITNFNLSSIYETLEKVESLNSTVEKNKQKEKELELQKS